MRAETFLFDGAFPPVYVQAQRALGVGIGVLCQLNAEVPFQGEALRRFEQAVR